MTRARKPAPVPRGPGPRRRRGAGSYREYLRIPELLALQRRLTREHDELQFIVVHQVFELWFKLVLFELEAARARAAAGELAEAERHLRRVAAIVRNLTAGFDVIETMRPADFLRFRRALAPASGFQSLQFRELEFLSGARDPRYLKLFSGEGLGRLRRRLREPSVWDTYLAALRKAGLSTRGEAATVASLTRVLADPRHPLAALAEAMIEYDELFSLWRERHVRMTMRMIGGRPGTGVKSVGRLVAAGYEQMGSGGVDYLKTTLPKTFFPLLWEARSRLGA